MLVIGVEVHAPEVAVPGILASAALVDAGPRRELEAELALGGGPAVSVNPGGPRVLEVAAPGILASAALVDVSRGFAFA